MYMVSHSKSCAYIRSAYFCWEPVLDGELPLLSKKSSARFADWHQLWLVATAWQQAPKGLIM